LPGDPAWTPLKGRFPVPPPESVVKEFDVTKFQGRWYISAGLNPLFDTFDCQAHFFEGFAPTGDRPGRVLGKINWRIQEPDGEFLTKSTVQKFVQTSPGVLENHDNEYLHYEDDWYVLDHADEDDPDNGFVLIYYRGRNDAWAGYGGGTLYTRAKQVPAQILGRVREACAKANVPFDKYWKTTDNTCPGAGDPVKLRSEYAEKLLEQAELSVEENLTLLARSASTGVEAEEQLVADGAKRLEKMTEDFIKREAKELGKLEKGVEKVEESIVQEQKSIKDFVMGFFQQKSPNSSQR